MCIDCTVKQFLLPLLYLLFLFPFKCFRLLSLSVFSSLASPKSRCFHQIPLSFKKKKKKDFLFRCYQSSPFLVFSFFFFNSSFITSKIPPFLFFFTAIINASINLTNKNTQNFSQLLKNRTNNNRDNQQQQQNSISTKNHR